MDDLKVSIIQADLIWENPEANCHAFDEKLGQLSEETDLIVLPEMFNTGFSLESKKLAESMDGPTVAWMKTVAAKRQCVLTGSVIIEEDGKFFNRLIWVRPDGSISHYNKRHLFRMAGEHHNFSAGKSRTIVELKGWRINLQVCYDLRFPVFSRNRADDQYDAMIYVANWPEIRRKPWSQLLYARAVENQCYIIAVNRVGEDGNKIPYSGDSIVINPKGEPMTEVPPSQEFTTTVSLSLSSLNAFRDKFPVGLDAD